MRNEEPRMERGERGREGGSEGGMEGTAKRSVLFSALTPCQPFPELVRKLRM